MINVDLPANLECAEKPCDARLSIKLALSVGGTLLPRLPTGHGWQLGNAPNGAFVCRCPQHHKLVDEAPQHLARLELAKH